MQIQNILSEDFTPEVAPRPQLRLRDLSPAQRRTLVRVADGVVDVDSANEAEFEVISDLYSLGLLDDEYQATKMGIKAVDVIKQLNAQEIEAARNRDSARANFKPDDVEPAALDTMGVSDDSVPDPDDEDEFDFSVSR